MQICCQDIYLHCQRKTDIHKKGSLVMPGDEEFWYTLFRSRTFQLIRVLGIPDDITRKAYWDSLTMGPRDLDVHWNVVWFRPKEPIQKRLLVEAFMNGERPPEDPRSLIVRKNTADCLDHNHTSTSPSSSTSPTLSNMAGNTTPLCRNMGFRELASG